MATANASAEKAVHRSTIFNTNAINSPPLGKKSPSVIIAKDVFFRARDFEKSLFGDYHLRVYTVRYISTLDNIVYGVLTPLFFHALTQ